MFAINFDDDGKITESIFSTALENVPANYLAFENEFDIRDFYVDVKSKQIHKIPPKPDGFYVWDSKAKVWSLNYDIAVLQVKAKRAELLVASDWTDTLSAQSRLDSDLRQAWSEYRQALRDITMQSEYPFNVIWPTQPE